MKILFFIESLHSGGKERRLVELIKGLQQYPDIKCELVLTKKNIHYRDIFDTGIKIHYIVRKYIKKNPKLFFLFYKICKKYNPDIIHVWGNMVAIYSIPAKLFLKIPMINNQIMDAPKKNIIKKGLLSYKIIFPFSDLIISNSKAGLKSYNAPKTKSRVIYNGFNFDRIKNLIGPSEIRREFNITTKYVICMVASFSDKKDYYTYIKAAISILDKRRNVTFLCIGAGNDSFYRKLVKPEYTENIKFLGRQENAESIMNICDIGILTTNPDNHGEGISNALMEFMALGKPVIATDGGGTKELIMYNENGFLISPKSPTVLAEKIIMLLDDSKQRNILGERGREIIRSKFNIEKMTESFVDVYKNVLRNKMKKKWRN
ncbi:MAG: glycosyltransferase [Bacteroidales bacterium]|nr:glycosyltransferase [Bacteroidales bacterium]